MQILTLSGFFGAATIGSHHGVGCYFLDNAISLHSSQFTFDFGKQQYRYSASNVHVVWCCILTDFLIFTGEVFINPVSPNTSGSIISSSMALGSLSNLRKPSAEASVRPSRLLPLIT